ncbi:hypothetical protein [Salsuginibacillus kocurii]|uniref:hypothetical protein n=1 Tax=Salsuginibacillus kocurii TaxID=427078 RepID=UPI000379663A|nr:hypothetical protein [Salsuginibacillus kocurii]
MEEVPILLHNKGVDFFMSVATDLLSLRVLGEALKAGGQQDGYQLAVQKLVNDSYSIEWAGIYLSSGQEANLQASSDEESPAFDESKTTYTFPLINEEEVEKGSLVIHTAETDSLEKEDITTLQTLAQKLPV